MTKQMKIFQIGILDSGVFVTTEAYNKAKENFMIVPVILYDENKDNYNDMNPLTEEIVGIIKRVDRIDGNDIIGTIDFFDSRYNLDNLNFELKTFQW